TEFFRRAGYFVTNGNSNLKKAGKTDYNFQTDREIFDGRDWRQRKKDQPFFAQVQIFQPHRPFHGESRRSRRAEITVPPWLPDHPVTRADISAYYSDVEALDHQVGKVVKRLDEDGLSDNTVVFFFGDHGRPQVRCKQWLYDGGIHVPLIVRLPENAEAGSVDHRMASLLDVTTTSMLLAGIPVPDELCGVDLLADTPERNFVFATRHRSGNAVQRSRCVRDERFKLIRHEITDMPILPSSYYKLVRYPVQSLMQVLHEEGKLTPAQESLFATPRPKEELYDTQSDPHELNNLADNPAHTEHLVRLRKKLDAWREKYAAPPEAASAVAAAIESSTTHHNRALKPRGLSLDSPPQKHLDWWTAKLLAAPSEVPANP
ncbi:MAG: sulfatase-like hydrolase/transferase, partial [Planctomycetota bacterium]